jgi:uncharacterized membrane protein
VSSRPWHRHCGSLASGVEETLHSIARAASLWIESMAVVVVAFGAADGFIKLLGLAAKPSATHGARKDIWRRFGTWLLLGLEFELAADIIGSVVSPTWRDIGELAAIALIRTFLNYFLERDLENIEPAEAATS